MNQTTLIPLFVVVHCLLRQDKEKKKKKKESSLGHGWVTYGSNGGLHADGEGACKGLRGWPRQISPPQLLHFLHSVAHYDMPSHCSTVVGRAHISWTREC